MMVEGWQVANRKEGPQMPKNQYQCMVQGCETIANPQHECFLALHQEQAGREPRLHYILLPICEEHIEAFIKHDLKMIAEGTWHEGAIHLDVAVPYAGQSA